ncbi:hypothetical protein Fuma_01844 [Fuerstiella marisgermanici]|uniref:Uncharacterized protein n=1 Tax=Fuerstiella marisgermanici TaxID=1891926 RepID=A0A1P8WDW4_9PLAN|nr:hypothetical protein Fuma_01844 [Fuerstiella marisgermanici]
MVPFGLLRFLGAFRSRGSMWFLAHPQLWRCVNRRVALIRGQRLGILKKFATFGCAHFPQGATRSLRRNLRRMVVRCSQWLSAEAYYPDVEKIRCGENPVLGACLHFDRTVGTDNGLIAVNHVAG